MLYTSILKTEPIQKALRDANVSDIPSPILKNGDFATAFDETSLPDYQQKIIDLEVLGRRSFMDFQHKMKEHEARMEPFKKKEARINAARPYVEKLVKGKLKGHFTSLEDAFVTVISEHVAEKHDFTGIEPMKEDENGLTELDRILKKARVTFLDRRVTPDDVVLGYLLNSSFIKML